MFDLERGGAPSCVRALLAAAERQNVSVRWAASGLCFCCDSVGQHVGAVALAVCGVHFGGHVSLGLIRALLGALLGPS